MFILYIIAAYIVGRQDGYDKGFMDGYAVTIRAITRGYRNAIRDTGEAIRDTGKDH